MMVLNAALADLNEKLRVARFSKCWNKRCKYAIHIRRTVASRKNLASEQRSFLFISAAESLVC
jgi:hypothetical protein